MNYPKFASFTVTNACNLRCKMCGQWSEEGYMHRENNNPRQQMKLEAWKRLVDELVENNIKSVLIRGGEPFLYPSIAQLLQYLIQKGMFVSIDTNGTFLDKYAELLVKLKKVHITISVDGPEQIHDEVRGVPGTFAKIKQGLRELRKYETEHKTEISTSMTFTISQYNYKYLGEMPDIARKLKIKTMVIVPYFYVPVKFGKAYEKELNDQFGCKGFTWNGFHHEESGIDIEEFKIQHQKYLDNLKEIDSYPYLPLLEDEYKNWFANFTTPVGEQSCCNIDNLIDIQPTGEVNFCVDTPDYSFGNVRENSVYELWNNEKAKAFRELRRSKMLSICNRCVARYMSVERTSS